MNYAGNMTQSFTEAAGLSTDTVPTRLYTDPAHFELERERIFRRAWLKVGRVEQIPDAGDYFVKEIAILSASIIITRAKSGDIRAMHNVCSHRGNLVAALPEGNASRFTCRYHSWTYKNTGELVGVPDENGFVGLDKKKCGLTPVACDVWDGWIFINLQPKPEVTLEQFLGSYGEAFKGIPYPHAENWIALSGEIRANWKALSDNFSEPYHIPTIHPKTLAPFYAGSDRPGTRPVNAEVFGAHRALGAWLNTAYASPPEARVARWLFPENTTVTGTQQEGQVNPLTEHPRVNPSKRKDWSSDVDAVFPNWQVQISATRFWTHEFWPRTINTSRWEARFYQPKPKTVRERIQLEHFTAMITEAFLEDLANIESTQRGMESGAKSFLHLHDSEILIRHSLEQVVKWTAASSAADALA
jgi:phenylpropionate dioxygenase-like ring-hydroxylating dioxygenase large terminal subunit